MTKKLTPALTLKMFREAHARSESSKWEECKIAFLAHVLGKNGEWGEHGAWANDLAEAVGVERPAIYDRLSAERMRLLFNYHLKEYQERIDDAADRGFSYFKVAYPYREETGMLDLLSDIEQAESSVKLAQHLRNKYGDGVDTAQFIAKQLKVMGVFLGMLETHHAPEGVRFAVKAAEEEIERWQRGIE